MTDQRAPDELRALNRLTFRELADAAGGLGGIHRGVASRVFRFVGPGGAPARMAHDLISDGVYRGLSGGTRLVGRGADLALGRRQVRDGQMLSRDPRGAAALAVINGL